MEPPEFPPNSEASKKSVEDKNIKRVTSGEVVRKKRSLRKQFSETFVAGDAKSAVRYVMFDVLLPAAKDMVVEAVSAGFEKLIFGESRRFRGTTPPQSGPTGYVSYNRMAPKSRLPSAQRAMSRQARARHDFDEIVLDQEQKPKK